MVSSIVVLLEMLFVPCKRANARLHIAFPSFSILLTIDSQTVHLTVDAVTSNNMFNDIFN